jgi:hypothetical protein
MYFTQNWEFGSALSKLRNFGGFEPPNPPSVRHWCLMNIPYSLVILFSLSQDLYNVLSEEYDGILLKCENAIKHGVFKITVLNKSHFLIN